MFPPQLKVCTLEKFNNYGDCRKCEDDTEHRCDNGECIPAKKVTLKTLINFMTSLMTLTLYAYSGRTASRTAPTAATRTFS